MTPLACPVLLHGSSPDLQPVNVVTFLISVTESLVSPTAPAPEPAMSSHEILALVFSPSRNAAPIVAVKWTCVGTASPSAALPKNTGAADADEAATLIARTATRPSPGTWCVSCNPMLLFPLRGSIDRH